MSNPALSALSAKWGLKVLIYTRNLPRQFAIIPASTTNLRIISRIQTKKLFAGKMLQKRLVLVVVSRHRLAVLPNRTFVSLHVLFLVFFAVVFVDGATKREEYLLHPPFPNVVRPTLPRLDSGAHCACVFTSLCKPYANAYVCAYAYVTV